MPAAAPAVNPADKQLLTRLGQQLRRVRQQQKVGTVAAAEAAGVSRVTLHRIEKGEQSVAMGAWVALASTLGLELALVDPRAVRQGASLPARIRLNDYPQLKALAWQLETVDELTPQEALQMYERNWRHLDASALSPTELDLIRALTRTLGGGRLLV